jgi:hypothetical protein
MRGRNGAPSLDTAGKLTGVLVFLVGITLLGAVFKFTVDTMGAAEAAVRQGDLQLRPLWGGGQPAPVSYPTDVTRSATHRSTAEAQPATSDGAAESSAAEPKPLSPLARFGMVLGARMVGLCALGFLAALIATQGAQMTGAFRASPRRELLP